MEIQRATLENCHEHQGTVVVVDVIRAFTAAAFAFYKGADEIRPVSTVQEAFEIAKKIPDALLMGEVDALPVEGFDFNNSPASLSLMDLTKRIIVHRTSSGTQGIVRSVAAEAVLAASFACAGATARYLKKLSPDSVTFVITGAGSADNGDEDIACAEYIEALLLGERVEPASYLKRVKASAAAEKFLNPDSPEYPAEDIECCVQLDRVKFALRVERTAQGFSMRTVWI